MQIEDGVSLNKQTNAILFEDSISITHGQNHCTVCAGRPIGVELGLARCLDRQALLPDGSVLLPHQDAW